MKRDNRTLKKKLKKHALPFPVRATEDVLNNKKKTVFFLLVLAVFQYYGWNTYLYQKLRNRESLDQKLRRWVFGEKKILYDSIQEQKPMTTLISHSTAFQLELLFQQAEQQLSFGVSRKLLFEILKNLNAFKKAEEEVSFYRQSGYYKKRNQKVCAVHPQQFLVVFEEALKTLQKEGITEQAFLEQFVEKFRELLPRVAEWEQKVGKKRDEYRKLIPHLQEQKVALVRKLLRDDPYATFDAIEHEVSRGDA